MSGGDEEGVEGWSGTVNQSYTSQPSDTHYSLMDANMDREFSDSQPIYRQLRDRVVAMILDGVLNEGDPLPSVRNVAAEYRVNPLTVLKGYQQLVDEELVQTKRGRGMFKKLDGKSISLAARLASKSASPRLREQTCEVSPTPKRLDTNRRRKVLRPDGK